MVLRFCDQETAMKKIKASASVAGFVFVLITLVSMPAFDDDLDKYKPAPPQPRSDFERALEHPIPPNPPPTALQQLERGQIPSNKNPTPNEGVSPTLNPPGVQYR